MYIYSFAGTLTPTLDVKENQEMLTLHTYMYSSRGLQGTFWTQTICWNVSCQKYFTKAAFHIATLLVMRNARKKCLHFLSKEWSRQIMVCWHIFGGRTISIIGTTGRHRAPADVTWHASNIWNTDINAKHTQPLCCLYVQNSHHCLIFWRWCFMACFLVPRQRMTESWMRF